MCYCTGNCLHLSLYKKVVLMIVKSVYFCYQVNWAKYKKCMIRVAFNAAIVGTVFQVMAWPFRTWWGFRYDLELPSFPLALIHLVIFIFTYEVLFYYTHR